MTTLSLPHPFRSSTPRADLAATGARRRRGRRGVRAGRRGPGSGQRRLAAIHRLIAWRAIRAGNAVGARLHSDCSRALRGMA